MRKINIIILLVLCLTLSLLTCCIVNTVIPETTSGNLENQENTEEPIIVDTEESGTLYPQKWSGLGMMIFNTGSASEFDDDVDTLLANGFIELRTNSDWYNWDEDTALLTAILSVITKGAHIIWGVESGAVTLTSSNWNDYANAVLAAAQWAQDNGVYEFQLGNEEEYHNDDTTLTDAQLIANLKSLATSVQAIFTNGKVSYSCWGAKIDDWITAGKGDIDILASNIYMGGDDEWKTLITNLVNAFGSDGTYLTEFGPSWVSLDDYSIDEAVQAAAVTEEIDYIKASGMTRAIFFCWKGDDFGVVKDDGTYRLLWDQALLNSGSVKSITVPAKTATISLPNTIALITK
jgi:hypothetical protein